MEAKEVKDFSCENKKAVFAYIVAFGKIPGAGFFPCSQRFYSRKKNEQLFSFLILSPGFLRRYTRMLFEIYIE
ncbi:hypothetical protein D3H55_17005 [Bacillus salacetis]|uniref:Uncharacterized protein n=1 Tax=Bacillus salacetis TaxID=2315464 RepID=A0A3A1QS80_9BACI|nr:hypothetical protein D3H55_17005 [Bacillus salacetis]